MKKILYSLIFAASLFMTACSSYTVMDSRVYNNADLSEYETFAIAEPDQNNMPPSMTMRDYRALAAAVRTQLEMRGYEETDYKPGLVVYIGITIQDRITTKDAIPPATPYYFGRRAAWLRDYYSDAKLITGVEKEGTVTVDIVDVADEKLVYSGAVGSVMDRQQHIRDTDELNKAMADLFKKFPIQPVTEKY